MRSGDAIALPVALAIVRQVCEALDYAHGLRDATGQWLGIVHRDVSPINIWVNETGRATLVASATAQASYGYMAPEYVMTGTLDWRADLFAVGVLAYELFTNRSLFTAGTERETIDRVCMLQIMPPSSVNPNLPPEVDAIVMPALARDPAHRWQYAAMIRDQIQGLAQRYGLDGAAMNPALWADLMTPRRDLAPPPAAQPPMYAPPPSAQTALPPVTAPPPEVAQPAPPPVIAAPPPPAAPAAAPLARSQPASRAPVLATADAAPANHPRVWAEAIDDGDGATRIEPMDSAMLVAFRALTRSDADQATPDPDPPVATRSAAGTKPAAGKPAAARPTPARQAPIVARAPIARAPAPPAEPEPEPEPEPEVQAPLIDRELGPEPTHIGAMPLISFGGDAPLTSKIGDHPRLPPRTSAPSIAPPVGTFLREPTAPGMAGTERLTMIVGIIVAVLVLIVIVLGIR